MSDTRAVSATPRTELERELNTCITDAVKNYGGDDDRERERTVRILCDDLYRQFGGFTLKEVELVIQEGTRGTYGDNFSVTVKNVLKWLKTYLMSDERTAAKRQFDAMHRNQRLDFDGTLARRNEESLWTLISRYYGQVNGGGHCAGIPINLARVYDFLREKGLRLADTKAEERPLMEDALNRAKQPQEADIWTGWMSFDEVTRAKALCLEPLIRRNIVRVYELLRDRV